MKDLVSFYKMELQRLRSAGQEFAEQYPRVAGRLQLGSDAAEDPQVEHLIQSFALLAARVHRRIDDDFPVFTEALLSVLYPHFLRPFPSCSIGRFLLGPQRGQMNSPLKVARGVMMNSSPVRGVACEFRTAYDVELAPVRIKSASYRNAAGVPSELRLPQNANASISIELELTSPQCPWSKLPDTLRVYLDGDVAQVSWLRHVLCRQVQSVLVFSGRPGSTRFAWSGPHSERPAQVGFQDDEALIDYDSRSQAGYRLLNEYFAFPEKFNFVDLPLPFNTAREQRSKGKAYKLTEHSQVLTLHFVLSDVRSNSDCAQALDSLSADNFVLGCTPLVNLFTCNANPIEINSSQTEYPITVNADKAHGFELYSVDRVAWIKSGGEQDARANEPLDESAHELPAFFSLNHAGRGIDAGAANAANVGDITQDAFWLLRKDDTFDGSSLANKHLLSIVDADLNPLSPNAKLAVSVTGTNRNLPRSLDTGEQAGRLKLGADLSVGIELIRKPTATTSFNLSKGEVWHLISHLSLNHLTLSGQGIDALKDLFRLYNLSDSHQTDSLIAAIQGIQSKPVTAWLDAKPFASFFRGVEIELTVDEQTLSGGTLSLLAQVLERFFPMFVHVNSFAQFMLKSIEGAALYAGKPRLGELPLV